LFIEAVAAGFVTYVSIRFTGIQTAKFGMLQQQGRSPSQKPCAKTRLPFLRTCFLSTLSSWGRDQSCARRTGSRLCDANACRISGGGGGKVCEAPRL